MTPKERLLKALHKEKTDRLPITVHQWQDYHLKHYLNGLDVLSAFRKFNLDAAIQWYDSRTSLLHRDLEDNINTKEWREEVNIVDKNLNKITIRHIIHTPKGNLTYITEKNDKTIWMIERPIKKKEDIELLKYMPIPKVNKKKVTELYDSIGEYGILRGSIGGDQEGCWQQACVYYGTTEMIYAAIDCPEWVHYFLNILLEKKLQYIYENLEDIKIDLFENGGGDASSTVISPKIFKEFVLPYEKKLINSLHSLNHLVTFHTCGGMKGIFDLIIKTGTDASETLAPKSIGGNIDGPDLYEAMHGKVTLIGGLDQVNILEKGSSEDVKKEVFRLFNVFGRGGGYICSCADHFFEAPLENLKALSEAAIECTY